MTVFRLLPIPFVVAATLWSPAPAGAQDPPPQPEIRLAPSVRAADDKNLSEQNVKIDITVTVKGAEKPIAKSLSMVAGDGRSAQGRAGVSMPVADGPNNFHYRDVGINADAWARILPSGKISLRMKLNFSTVYKDTPSGDRPSFGNGMQDVESVVFESGKPIVVFHGADAESGRDYSVQVTATILK